jgi:hypothetical protein
MTTRATPQRTLVYASDARVEALATKRYQLDWPRSGDDWPDRVPPDEAASYRTEALAVLRWLAGQGYLLPESAEVRMDWEAWCHAGEGDGIVLSCEYSMPSRGQAEEWARQQIGRYGITRYTIVWREHRCFPDGSTWAGPWVPAGGVGP